MQAQYVGTTVRIVNAFSDSGVPTDPTVIVMTLKLPSGTTTTYTYGVSPELTRLGTGEYRFEFVPSLAGQYLYVWIGTGAVIAQEPGVFEVLATAIRTPAYMSSADLDKRVSASKIDELFDDDGDSIRDSIVVAAVLVEAEDFAATRMLKSWTIEQINQMAATDETFRAQVAWVALELATERRSEFLAEDGKGRYWQQYMRAKEHFDALAKSKIASAAEATVGKNKQSGGSLSPTVQQPPGRFTWAPDKYNPYGKGGY